ncbi:MULTISPECIES: hypothetical protein [unclassified Novosphingobium]|uniref:hypothetical protein n=1 Tax=unclassified Novosphingobium TaxID=2644732 RepID=UPI00135BD114|nr:MULTISPECIES: hypothetical protein [unclassified Novosphingobium]
MKFSQALALVLMLLIGLRADEQMESYASVAFWPWLAIRIFFAVTSVTLMALTWRLIVGKPS